MTRKIDTKIALALCGMVMAAAGCHGGGSGHVTSTAQPVAVARVAAVKTKLPAPKGNAELLTLHLKRPPQLSTHTATGGGATLAAINRPLTVDCVTEPAVGPNAGGTTSKFPAYVLDTPVTNRSTYWRYSVSNGCTGWMEDDSQS